MRLAVYNLASDQDRWQEAMAGERQTWKYVVITTDDERAFITGPVSRFPYHANLVDYYCGLRSIASTWVKKPDVVEVLERGTEVLGGGYMALEGDGSRLKLYGLSTTYGLCNPRFLRDFIKTDPFFAAFEVEMAYSE